MKYVFGPVPSRRLGQSLGIDPIPLKTCNWNCIYCQLGRTRPVVNQRQVYHPTQGMLAEVDQALNAHQPGEIDWITIVGSGEPTLHEEIGALIQGVKARTTIPLAVISNGALFYDPVVRQALIPADAVLPSLDAGSQELTRKINRPHPQVTFERHLEGLVTFRQEYNGKLWVEVMLVRGVNDTDEALQDIRCALARIQPDEVHLNLPTRPPAETWVQPADEQGIERAKRILGEVARLVMPVRGRFDLSGYPNVMEAIIAIIGRHPMRQDELERALSEWSPANVEATLAELEASDRVQVVERHGTRFWSLAPAYYPDDEQSQACAPASKRGRNEQSHLSKP